MWDASANSASDSGKDNIRVTERPRFASFYFGDNLLTDFLRRVNTHACQKFEQCANFGFAGGRNQCILQGVGGCNKHQVVGQNTFCYALRLHFCFSGDVCAILLSFFYVIELATGDALQHCLRERLLLTERDVGQNRCKIFWCGLCYAFTVFSCYLAQERRTFSYDCRSALLCGKLFGCCWSTSSRGYAKCDSVGSHTSYSSGYRVCTQGVAVVARVFFLNIFAKLFNAFVGSVRPSAQTTIGLHLFIPFFFCYISWFAVVVEQIAASANYIASSAQQAVASSLKNIVVIIVVRSQRFWLQILQKRKVVHRTLR